MLVMTALRNQVKDFSTSTSLVSTKWRSILPRDFVESMIERNESKEVQNLS